MSKVCLDYQKATRASEKAFIAEIMPIDGVTHRADGFLAFAPAQFLEHLKGLVVGHFHGLAHGEVRALAERSKCCDIVITVCDRLISYMILCSHRSAIVIYHVR